jgi:hypothetical protein
MKQKAGRPKSTLEDKALKIQPKIKRPKCKPDEKHIRRAELLKDLLALALKIGLKNVTGYNFQQHYGIQHSVMAFYFGTFEKARARVLDIAIEKEIIPILAEYVAEKKDVFPFELKMKIFSHLTN